MLLEKGTIRITGNKFDYNEVNMIKDYFVGAMSDDEYVSADEFFSSDEIIFYDDSVIPEYSKEAWVNAIVPHFGVPAPVEITYPRKPVVAPVFICLPGLIPYESDKVVPYKYNATILEDGVEILYNLCPMLRILLKLVE